MITMIISQIHLNYGQHIAYTIHKYYFCTLFVNLLAHIFLYREKEAALETLVAQKKSIVDMQTREKMLKEQLKLYTEKYEDFQGSLKKSNDIFTVYKNEIEKVYELV